MRSRVREATMTVVIDEGMVPKRIDDASLSIFGPDDKGGTDRLVQIVIDDPSEFGTVVLTMDEQALRDALGPSGEGRSDG